MKQPAHIIVIGTSAGGLNALSEFVRYLDDKMDAAFFVVMHLSMTSISDFLISRLQPLTTLVCKKPGEGMAIERGVIYIAPPNQHLLVKKNEVSLGKGPSENRWKPSIDVLFRSAAASYGSAVTGIVLTGMLDDGTAGMHAIKKCGGVCIVQDPNEAEYPDMPLSVLNSMEVDHCVPLNAMGKIIADITKQEPVHKAIPAEIITEAEIAERVVIGFENVQQLGPQSLYACPDCGGGLFEIDDIASTRYRCHIGHSYSEKDLSIKQAETLEATLWIALRIMEEKKNLLQKMEISNGNKGFSRTALEFRQKVFDIQQHIDKLKDVLFSAQRISEVA